MKKNGKKKKVFDNEDKQDEDEGAIKKVYKFFNERKK